MSKRLQVLLDEDELNEIRSIARRHRMTVAEWVRQSLRAARAEEPASSPAQKRAALRRAERYSFPTADIERMVAEIESGYSESGS